MPIYDGQPVGVPVLYPELGIAGDFEVWATLHASGVGTIEYRSIAGGPTATSRAREVRLNQAAAVLEQWAVEGRATTVTNGNNNAVTQTMVNRLAVFFDNMADLLRSLGKS